MKNKGHMGHRGGASRCKKSKNDGPKPIGVLSAKDRQRIVSALRRVWRNSESYKQKRNSCLIDKSTALCESCFSEVHKKLLELDHITPIGGIVKGCAGDWNEYIRRLMFGELQGLCPDCHKTKTSNNKTKE